MFERDTGRNTRGGGAEVEFEFSDDESESGAGVPSFKMSHANGRGARGGARGRGEGRGRARGGKEGAGARGGRGTGWGDDGGRDWGGGRGRGESRNGHGGEARAVAALPPRGLPRPAGLPAKPNFVPDMPDAHDGSEVASAGPMRSPPIANVGAPPTSFPPITFGATTPPPFFGAGAPAPPLPFNPPQFINPTFGEQQQQHQPQPQLPPSQNAYSPFNPALGGSANYNPAFQQPYPNQPFAGGYPQYPQGGYPQPPPPQFGAAPNAVSGGHFNPRFFAQQQQGGAPYPPPGQFGQGAYPPHGFQGQPFMGQQQQQQQPWGYPGAAQGPGMGRPGPPGAPGGLDGGAPPGWPANGGR